MNRIFLFILLLICRICSAQPSFLYPVEIKGKWGYMNASGEMVITPQYDLAQEFSEGVAVVALNNLPCLINQANKILIDTGHFRSISRFSEGLAFAVGFNNRKQYIDPAGRSVIPLPDSIYDGRPFQNGLAVVGVQFDKHEVKFEVDISTVAFRFGYLKKNGDYLTGMIYDDADDMQQGVARVKSGNHFGLIDSTGKQIIAPVYDMLDQFFEGKAAVSVKGKWGYIDQKGKLVIPPTFDLAFDFNEGLAGVYINKQFGYINADGKLVIPAIYEGIRAFSDGLAAVQKNNQWGFINVIGTTVIPFRFANASNFSEGLCAVVVKNHWGFINKYGNVVISPEFDAVGSFANGVADVVYHDVSLYINKAGNIIPVLNK